jgi:L-rhamnose mutarotase
MNLKEGYRKKSLGETKRYCQYLELNPDTLEEYKYWHNSLNMWKEIPEGIRKAGILDMEIYLAGNHAFMIVETPDAFNWEVAFGRLATFERQIEWEEFVSKFQKADKGKRSEEKWQLMERIYSLEEALERGNGKTGERENVALKKD